MRCFRTTSCRATSRVDPHRLTRLLAPQLREPILSSTPVYSTLDTRDHKTDTSAYDAAIWAAAVATTGLVRSVGGKNLTIGARVEKASALARVGSGDHRRRCRGNAVGVSCQEGQDPGRRQCPLAVQLGTCEHGSGQVLGYGFGRRCLRCHGVRQPLVDRHGDPKGDPAVCGVGQGQRRCDRMDDQVAQGPDVHRRYSLRRECCEGPLGPRQEPQPARRARP